MDDAQLKARAWAGAVDFQRLVGRHAPGATLHERDEVVASVVPGVQASILNAAIAQKPEPQSANATAAIARLYEDSDVAKWGVWIDADDNETAATLEGQGLVLDSTPVLMGAELANITEPDDQDPPTIITAGLADLGRINDLAYGYSEPRIGPVLAGFPPGGPETTFHTYGAHTDDGEIASVAMIHDVGDDACVTFVATVPDARGRGLATHLLKQALHEAKERGQHTTTLQASKPGQGIYAAIGFRPLGEQHLWERRP